MRFLNARYATVLLLIAILGCLGRPTQVVAQEEHTSGTMVRMFDELCANYGEPTSSSLHPQYAVVLNTLKQLPLKEVIPAVVDALRNDARFRVVVPRRTLYAILGQLNDRNDERAHQQLLIGLIETDSSIVASCAKALAQLNEHIRKRAVVVLLAQWNGSHLDQRDPSQSLDQYKVIVKTLAVFGPSAKDFLENAVHLFCSEELVFENRVIRLRDIMPLPKLESQIGEGRTSRSSVAYRLRVLALGTVYGIGGVEEVVKLAERDDLDEDAQQMIVGSFAGLGARSQGTFHTDAAHRERIREIALRGMTSPFENVRKAALQSLVWSFGEDWVVIRSREDYEIHPQLKAALKNMAANDADEALRQQAASSLVQMEERFLERAVENILRKRKKDKESRGPQLGGRDR